MFKSLSSLLLVALASPICLVSAQQSSQNATINKIGWSGMLSTLDGGLSGTVVVVDAMTLEVMNYVLKDASAPALYWWGTTTQKISEGFRISNTHVTQTSDGSTLMIALDAGKTTADFSVVGLWCERLAADFGQATLAATGTTSASSSGSSGSGTATSAAATSSSSSSATRLIDSYGGIVGPLMVISGLSLWIL